MSPMGQASLEERLTKVFCAIQSARTLGSCDPSAVTSGNVSAVKDSSLEAAPRTISIADAVGAAHAEGCDGVVDGISGTSLHQAPHEAEPANRRDSTITLISTTMLGHIHNDSFQKRSWQAQIRRLSFESP